MKERCRRRNFHAGDTGREEEARGDWSVRSFVVTDIARIDKIEQREISIEETRRASGCDRYGLRIDFRAFEKSEECNRVIREFPALRCRCRYVIEKCATVLYDTRNAKQRSMRRVSRLFFFLHNDQTKSLILLRIGISHFVQTVLNVRLEISKFFERTPHCRERTEKCIWGAMNYPLTIRVNGVVMPGDIPSGEGGGGKGDVYRSWKTKPHSRVSSSVSARALERS